jgi:large subunit ribosomal protein L30
MAGLTITQVKSANGSSKKQLGTLRTLGLGRIGRQVERPDDDVVRGQVHSIRHLVEVKNG